MSRKNAFDYKPLLDEFVVKSEAILSGFLQSISGIAPNKIDMNKLKSLIVAGKSIKDHEKSGAIMINPNGPRSAKVDSLDPTASSKVYRAAVPVLIEAGFAVVENGGSLLINLPQMTEDMRKDMVKQVKSLKEASKQRINDLRADAHKAIKAAQPSEDIQSTAKAEIDKAKDKAQKKLDTECSNKEHAIMKG